MDIINNKITWNFISGECNGEEEIRTRWVEVLRRGIILDRGIREDLSSTYEQKH